MSNDNEYQSHRVNNKKDLHYSVIDPKPITIQNDSSFEVVQDLYQSFDESKVKKKITKLVKKRNMRNKESKSIVNNLQNWRKVEALGTRTIFLPKIYPNLPMSKRCI
jgi:hypothetical protein